jgi:hypothetical protein
MPPDALRRLYEAGAVIAHVQLDAHEKKSKTPPPRSRPAAGRRRRLASRRRAASCRRSRSNDRAASRGPRPRASADPRVRLRRLEPEKDSSHRPCPPIRLGPDGSGRAYTDSAGSRRSRASRVNRFASWPRSVLGVRLAAPWLDGPTSEGAHWPLIPGERAGEMPGLLKRG